jgi:hypothetical protein
LTERAAHRSGSGWIEGYVSQSVSSFLFAFIPSGINIGTGSSIAGVNYALNNTFGFGHTASTIFKE